MYHIKRGDCVNNKPINETLGARIKTCRKSINMTREQLAEKIDVSTRFLADVESGKTGVSLITLKKICFVLSVTSDYLLGNSDFSDEKQQYINIDNKIRQIDKKYLFYLNKIIDTFCSAVNDDN